MSDISAVVLTIGEWFTQRALDSIAGQTLPPEEVIVVQNVSPFYRAMNDAALRVKTPFFVQVDADMILDPECTALLRGAVREDTGIAVGELRDRLVGRAVGIKLFRTECFRQAEFRDSISPDTDFGAEIARLGWKTHYVARQEGSIAGRSRTLGEHRPDYTPEYTYRKHLIEGGRLRYRGARGGLRWRFERLEESSHPLAGLAQIALGHGFFLPAEQDQLMPWGDEPDAGRLLALLESKQHYQAAAAELFPLDRHRRLRDVYRCSLRAGHALGANGGGATVRDTLATITGTEHGWRGLVTKIGLGHGIVSPDLTVESLSADERMLGNFITFGIGSPLGGRQLLRARATTLMQRLCGSGEIIRW
jgi:hypothetical protein